MKAERLLHAIGGIDENLIAEAEHDKGSRHITTWRRLGLMAACLALVVCAGITVNYLRSHSTVGAFTMDVNPSVEYTLAKNGTVKDVSFLNSDAEEALRDVTLKKQSVEIAIERTVAAYKDCGYMDNSHGTVLVSFDSRINGNSKLKDELITTIENALKQTDAVETLVFHDDSDDDRAGEIADKYNISRGKADYILAASGRNGMTEDELSLLPLDELLIWQDDIEGNPFSSRFIGILRAKQIALKDAGCINKVIFTEEKLIDGGIKTPYYNLIFADSQYRWTYRIDAVLGTILEKSKVSIAGEALITLEEAKTIALKDAGLDGVGTKVVFTKEKLSSFQGATCYLLEFYTEEYQYSYHIGEKDGGILGTARFITLAKAKAIAMNDAGATTHVTFTEAKLIDGGIKTPYYRLVFDDGVTRWTYQIDATDGRIQSKSQENISIGEYITLEKAKTIALKDAGLENADLIITFTREELDLEQDPPCYLIEFIARSHQYKYRIDAINGNILYKSNYILLSEAKKIALDDAGVVNKVIFTDESLVDGGIKTPYYHLVFADDEAQWTYRIDAVLGIILEKNKESIAAEELISTEEAKAIAIKDAGLESVDTKIVFTKEELYRNNGAPYYLLEFYTGRYQYSYKIDAKTGSILESRRYFRLSDAKQIALKDAGCTDQVAFTEEKLIDGGIKTPYYSFIFTDSQCRWTYRIDAVLGGILEKNKESIAAVELISTEEAKAIAIKDAGLESVDTKIVFTKEELYRNNGAPYYLLEFYTGQYQYYYKIDAKTGSILESRRYIRLSDAKQIALKDAGCINKVVFTEEKLVDGGIKTPYYNLIFADSQYRWTYRIDAVLGIILEKNKE